MASNPIDCIKLHAKHLSTDVNISREAATDLALKEFEKLHGELENFKKSINPKYTKKAYISPDKSEAIKKITDDYQKQIDEANTPIPEPIKAEEKPQPEKTIVEDKQGAGKEPPIELPKKEGVEGEGDVAGITHAANEVRRQDRALPEYQKEPQSFEQWNNEAEKAIKEGYDVEALMDRLEKGELGRDMPIEVENAIRKIYVATLDAEIAKNPTDALLAKQKRFIEIGDVVNSQLGRGLVSLKGEGSPLSSISDFYVAKMEAAGVDKLTEQQKKETKEAFDKVQKADENATAAMEAYREEIAKLKAENELLRSKKTTTTNKTKRTHDDYVKERDTFRERLKEAKEKHEKWLKEQGIQKSGFGFTLTGEMVKEIKNIVKSHVEENVSKLQDVISKVLEDIKDIFPEITDKDIRDVIAGEYNEKKPTRNELAAKMRDLKDEAYYINKLERLLKGEEPKNHKKQVERNRQIKELQQKIKEFLKEKRDAEKEPAQPKTPKEEVDGDLKKLEAIKKRNETETVKIKERIAKGDFETKKQVPFLEDPEMQKKFPKQYKEALDAIVKREDARHEFDIALMKDQMSKRSVGKKGIDLAGDVIGTTKAVVTGIDASGIGIQNLVAMIAHPRSAAKALPASFGDFASAQRMDRWLASVHNSKQYPLSQKAGLDISEPKSLKAIEREDIFTHNLLDKKIKFKGKEYVISKYITKPFERIFTGLGNRMRWNLWTRGVDKLYEEGYTWESHPEEFKSLAKILNTETGRGSLHPQVDKAFNFISAGIWSPRLMASRLNILGLGDVGNLIAGGKKGYYGGLTPKMRAYALKDFSKFVIFGTTLMAMAGLTFADDVDFDPRSVTFGSFVVNGKRYNMWGGFTQYVRLIAKYITGGEKVKGDFRESSPLKTTGKFLWSKTTPAVGLGIGLMNKDKNSNIRRDYMGQPITAENAIESLTVPLSIRGIAHGVEKEGLGSILWTGVPSFVGMNVGYESDFASSNLTDEDKKDPTIKLFREKGIRFPEFNPERIQTKEVNGKVTEHLSDYPKDQQEKYIDAKKKAFKEELKSLKNGDYEVYRDENGTVHIRSENTDVSEMEEVRFKDLTPEDIQYLIGTHLSGNATRKAKEEVELKMNKK